MLQQKTYALVCKCRGPTACLVQYGELDRQLACYRNKHALLCTVSVGDLPACPVQYGELEAAGMLQENNMP